MGISLGGAGGGGGEDPRFALADIDAERKAIRHTDGGDQFGVEISKLFSPPVIFFDEFTTVETSGTKTLPNHSNQTVNTIAASYVAVNDDGLEIDNANNRIQLDGVFAGSVLDTGAASADGILRCKLFVPSGGGASATSINLSIVFTNLPVTTGVGASLDVSVDAGGNVTSATLKIIQIGGPDLASIDVTSIIIAGNIYTLRATKIGTRYTITIEGEAVELVAFDSTIDTNVGAGVFGIDSDLHGAWADDLEFSA